MAKQSPRAPRSDLPPPTSRSNRPRNWRRGHGPDVGSWWNLLWRKNDDAEAARIADPKRRQYAFRVRLGASVLTIAVLTAVVIVYLLSHLPTQTSLVAVAVCDYTFPIPPNAYASEDLQAFHSFGQLDKEAPTRTNVRLVGKLPAERDPKVRILDELRNGLDDPNCKPGGPGKNVILVYVSAHGVVNEKGEACLVERNSDPLEPLDSQKWTPLKLVLDELRVHKKCGAESEVFTVLFLDCSKSPDEWTLGQLHNSFVANLTEEVKRVDHPRLVVISSAGPGQTGWTSPALGGSVFGFFLKVGLGGAASTDGWTVTLADLTAYLTKHMAAWSMANHGAAQTPFVVSPKDFSDKLKLAFASGGDKADAQLRSLAVEREQARRTELIEAERQWVQTNAAELAQRYREMAVLEPLVDQGPGSLHPASRDPLTWSLLRQKLVYLDRLLVAGRHFHRAESNYFGDEHDKVQKLLRDLRKPPSDLSKAALSFPLAEQFSQGGAGQGKSEPIDPASAKAVWDSLVTSAATPAGVKRAQLKPPEPPPTRDHSEATGLGAAEHVETHFLRMLAAYLLEDEAVEREIGNAVLARDLAERAAAPSELRAVHWIEDLVDAGDARRRRAEDWLMIGDQESLEQAERNWPHLSGGSETQGEYKRAATMAVNISRALRARDKSWADALPLAAWVLSRDNPKRDADVPKFRKWLKGLRALSAELHRPKEIGGGTLAALEEEVRRLESLDRALGILHAELIGSYSQNGLNENAQKVDERQAKQLELLLRLPPLDSATGKALHANAGRREKYLDYLFGRTQPAGAKQASSAADVSFDAQAAEELAFRASLWNNWLALECLQPDPPESDESRPAVPFPSSPKDQYEVFAERGGMLRKNLQQAGLDADALERDALKLLASGVIAANVEKEPELAWEQERKLALNVRRKISEADLRLRSAAPLLPKRPAADPAQRLARLDLLCEFLWQARRNLNDFWGPGPRGGAPYFNLAARNYVDAAEAAWPAQEAQLLSGSLRALWDRRNKAAEAQHGLLPWPTEVIPATEGEFTSHRIKLEASAGLPPGEAAVFVSRYGQSPASLAVFAESDKDTRPHSRWPYSVTGEPVSLDSQPAGIAERLANSDLAGLEALQAVSLFRGHLRPRDFRIIRPGQGETVAFERPPLSPPRITVTGFEKHSKLVVFIFDCSKSMEGQVANAKAEALRVKIDVARNALNTILSELPDETFRVALWVYGHRAGGFEDNRPEVNYSELLPPKEVSKMRDAFASGRGPRPPAPSNDVEEILEPSPLDDTLRATIRGKLGLLKPHGHTPLCFSIKRALEELASRYPNVLEKQIVVLTDGLNFQTQGSNPDLFDSDAVVSESHLKRLLEDNKGAYGKIRLDIVGFDLGSLTRDQKGQLAKMEEIAKQQFGSFRRADDLDSLINELNDSIALPKYKVQPEEAPDAAREVRLGKTWLADDDWKVPAGQPWLPYDISLLVNKGKRLTSKVDLEGGEALKLVYTPLGLSHEFYDPSEYGLKIEDESAVVGKPYHVTALVPERFGAGFKFPIVIQHDKANAHRFTGRPRHVWAEIRPTDFQVPPSGTPPVFHCYDPEFEEGKPKPVVRFVVAKWPALAQRAQLRLWFRAHDDPENPPSEALSWEGRDAKDLRLTATATKGVTFDVASEESAGVTVVKVTERPGPNRDLMLRITMSPPPDKGHHIYFAETRQVQHRFVFFGTRPGKIEVATRDDIQRRAITLPEGKALDLKLPPN